MGRKVNPARSGRKGLRVRSAPPASKESEGMRDRKVSRGREGTWGLTVQLDLKVCEGRSGRKASVVWSAPLGQWGPRGQSADPVREEARAIRATLERMR